MLDVNIQYLTDTDGNQIAVVLPIEFWRKLIPQDETSYLLSSKIMKNRLIEAMNRNDGFTLEEVREKLGI